MSWCFTPVIDPVHATNHSDSLAQLWGSDTGWLAQVPVPANTFAMPFAAGAQMCLSHAQQGSHLVAAKAAAELTAQSSSCRLQSQQCWAPCLRS